MVARRRVCLDNPITQVRIPSWSSKRGCYESRKTRQKNRFINSMLKLFYAHMKVASFGASSLLSRTVYPMHLLHFRSPVYEICFFSHQKARRIFARSTGDNPVDISHSQRSPSLFALLLDSLTHLHVSLVRGRLFVLVGQ